MANPLHKTRTLPQIPYNYPSAILVAAISKVYAAVNKLEWVFHLAIAKMRTMQIASAGFLNNVVVSLLGHVRIKRLQNFEKRFFLLRKWHLLLSGALFLRLVQKLWHRRANNKIARNLRALMDAAETYEEWQTAARALDSLEHRVLPLEPSQVAGLRDRTAKLRKMQQNDDIHALMWALRQDISRNVGNLLSAAVEKGKVHCVVPPVAVTEYVEEMQKALHFICHSALPIEERMRFVRELRHAYGRTGLVLSGGGSFSHYHFGIVRTLFSAGLLPRVLSGSSGGAIAASMLCTRTDPELQQSIDTWPTAPNTDFFGPAKGVKGTIKHFISNRTLHSAEIYKQRLQRLMGDDLTFQEAYARSGRVLNIAIVAADTHEPCRVLNYLTAPNVVVWSAVACSSAFPFLFEPSELLMKDSSGKIVPHFVPCVSATLPEENNNNNTNSTATAIEGEGDSSTAATTTPTSSALESAGRMRRWCDGSLEEDLPMRCLGELFGVNYFLVSQCNPWLIPVLSVAQRLPSRLALLIELEVKHRCGQLLSVFPRNKLMKLVAQPWGGDLNFILPVTTFSIARSAVNFTPDEIIKAMRAGQRAVWSKLPAVRAACAVEIAVDAELKTLTMQARAMRRREEHAVALTHRALRASIPSWMDLKSLGLGTSTASSDNSTDDMLGVRTPRTSSSTERMDRLVQPAGRLVPVTGSSDYNSTTQELSEQQGSDEMEQLGEPWETAGLLLHRNNGVNSGSGGGGEGQRLEGGVDVWKDLTALTLGEDSLDFIAP